MSIPPPELPTPPPLEDNARELTPVQMFWDGSQNIKDFGPRPVKANVVLPDEVAEVEEVLTPVPKDSSVQAPVILPESPPIAPQSESVIHVPAAPATPTEKLEAVVKESGKDSASSVVDPPTPPATPQPPVPSLPSFSTPTSPGVPALPASVKPQTSE